MTNIKTVLTDEQLLDCFVKHSHHLVGTELRNGYDDDQYEVSVVHKHVAIALMREIEQLVLMISVPTQEVIDTKRLDFICHNELQMVMSRDGDVCTIWKWNDEHERVPYWGYPQRWFDSTREAIDAAMI